MRREGCVEVGGVGRVVLRMVYLHRARVDVRLKRVVIVTEVRKRVRIGHGRALRWLRGRSPGHPREDGGLVRRGVGFVSYRQAPRSSTAHPGRILKLMTSSARILLVDCDSFFVQVARLEDPEGRGTPPAACRGRDAGGPGRGGVRRPTRPASTASARRCPPRRPSVSAPRRWSCRWHGRRASGGAAKYGGFWKSCRRWCGRPRSTNSTSIFQERSGCWPTRPSKAPRAGSAR